MKELEALMARIVQRNNINLREIGFDARPYIWSLLSARQMSKFYAFYGITPNHPLNLQFRHSALAGSYFLGRCRVSNSLLYKSDIRGDELKKKGETVRFQDVEINVSKDEEIDIEDSALIKTLVHNYSHDPETPETFFIKDTVSTHYANIHGSPMDGSFLGPFATVDLTTMRDCVIGAFSYIQAGEISHLRIDPGTIWIHIPGLFNFLYRYRGEDLDAYIRFTAKQQPVGTFMDFVEDRKEAFQRIFDPVNIDPLVSVPETASLDRYAVVDAKTAIGENVLISQRAFLQNATLGKGANAQENCFIINSSLEGNNVTAHGAKIIESTLEKNVFVGFNSFLRGGPEHRLTVGNNSVIMPHTIIDTRQPLSIPPEHLVWGLLKEPADLETNSMPLEAMSQVDSGVSKGTMYFEGSGAAFVKAFQDRIHHILEANGAFFDGTANRGHAQRNRNLSINTIQPYAEGELEGLYPTIDIRP